MPEITCPECGHQANLVAIRRGAEEFCPQCDFPLFWASSAVPAMSKGSNSDNTLRRLPGAGGRRPVGSKICPGCGELNPVSNVDCLRCGVELDPRPPEPETEPELVIAAFDPPTLVWVADPPEKPWLLWSIWAVSLVGVLVFLSR